MTTQWSKAKETSNQNHDFAPSAARTVKRSMSQSVQQLQNELNEAAIKHAETVYFLQLELDTTRRAKEALEDRMAELYRDVTELQNFKPKPRPVIPDAEYVATQQKQLEKYERIMRIMNNQISLVRSSSDTIVKSLKEEISDLMDEKVKTELNLMNRLSELHKENQELTKKISSAEKLAATSNAETVSSDHSSNHCDRVKPPRPPIRHNSVDDDETTKLLQEDLKRLRQENKVLKEQAATKPETENTFEIQKLQETVKQLTVDNNELTAELVAERTKFKDSLVTWTEEKAAMDEQLQNLQTELEKSSLSDDAQNVLTNHREAVASSLERVALLWDRADESIQSVEGVMMELRPNDNADSERLLSTLETANLVHGQIKVSLMLIELQFRNNLACLQNDHSTTSAAGSSVDISEQMKNIQQETLESIEKVEALVEEQMEELRSKSARESLQMRELHESKIVDLRQMRARQKQLEAELARLQHEKNGGKTSPSPLETFVSQAALQTLQNEVLQVVERVKEKNETIGRLTAEIEEHKVRERTLMEELKRHMKDQADRQLQEQQRIMEQNAQYEDSDDGSAGSGGSSDYEEQTVENTIYEETTIYEEQTVL